MIIFANPVISHIQRSNLEIVSVFVHWSKQTYLIVWNSASVVFSCSQVTEMETDKRNFIHVFNVWENVRSVYIEDIWMRFPENICFFGFFRHFNVRRLILYENQWAESRVWYWQDFLRLRYSQALLCMLCEYHFTHTS